MVLGDEVRRICQVRGGSKRIVSKRALSLSDRCRPSLATHTVCSVLANKSSIQYLLIVYSRCRARLFTFDRSVQEQRTSSSQSRTRGEILAIGIVAFYGAEEASSYRSKPLPTAGIHCTISLRQCYARRVQLGHKGADPGCLKGASSYWEIC